MNNQNEGVGSRLTQMGLEYRESGSEIVIKECPLCPPHQDKPDNLWKLNINVEKGLYCCHRCPDSKGTLKHFFEKTEKQVWCKKIWNDSIAANENDALPLRLYFKNRGLSPDSHLESIRFHRTLSNGELHFPALVARVSNLGHQLVGIQRIFLTQDGKKAPVDQVKMSLGSVIGSAVQLDHVGDTLAVAEGIETALAVRQITKLPTWSAVSAPGMERLIIPGTVKVVRIFSDFDPKGRGQNAAEKLAARLHKNGMRVFVHTPQPEMIRGH